MRVPAVTPTDLAGSELDRLATARHGRSVRPIELACIKSHLLAWEQFLSGDAPFAAFFEDDALLSDSLPGFLADYTAAGGWGLDLIRLEDAPRVRLYPARQITARGLSLHEFRSALHGTAGYVLTRQAAQRLLAFPGWGKTQFDLALYDPLRAPGNLVSRALLDPALCVQFANRLEGRANDGLGRSDIDPPKEQEKAQPPAGVTVRRMVEDALLSLAAGLHNAADHVIQRGKGLRSGRVRFKGDSLHMVTAPARSEAF